MAITVKHKFVSTIPDDPDATLIRPSNWNDTHDLVGTVPIANGGTNATTAADALTNLGAFPATSTTGTGSVVLATGATQAHPTISDYEIFTSTTPPSYAEGRVWFDSLNHTLAQFNDVTNNTVHLGEEIQLKVINNTGSTINIGQPVYITGTSSGQTYPNVALAIANSLTTANVIGLANQAIPNGTAGYVTTIGLIQGINTGTYTVGDTLYLSPYSAGFYQNTIPPTGYAVKLGTVAYVNSSTGAIYINKSNLSVQAGNIVGQVSVANGGTGASTLTGYVKGSGTSALTASSTIPNTDISGLGTLSTQNANAVAVTGGTIDNAVIGGTTPAAGTFTTITGQTEVLKGTGENLATQSQSFSTWSTLATTTSINATTAPDSTNTATSLIETTANSRHILYFQFSPSLSAYTLSAYVKANQDSVIQIQAVTNNGAIYFAALANLSTGSIITTTSSGSPTGTSSTITSAGNGWYRISVTMASFVVATPSYFIFALSNSTTPTYDGNGNPTYTGNASNGLYVWGAQIEIGSTANTYIPTTTTAIYGTPTLSFSGVAGLGLQSDGSLYVSPAGTGALQAQKTDSTATGGNARGANAVDWQTSRGAASQVASAQNSFIGAGYANTNSGAYGFLGSGYQNTNGSYGGALAGGFVNSTSNLYTFVGGGYSNTSSGERSAVAGGQANTAAGYLNFIGGGFTNSGTSGSAVTTQSGTMNATTAVTLSGSNASIKVGQYISGTSIAGDTYVAAISGTSLTLSKNASGSSTSTLSFYTPHGVVVGGGNNQATGSYSFIGGGGDAGTSGNRNVASGDWSVVCGGRANTASGIASFVGGGGTNPTFGTFPNTASGLASSVVGGFSNVASNQGTGILCGYANQATGTYSAVIQGNGGTTRGINGSLCIPSGSALTVGGSQSSILILAKQTTDATATVLVSDGNAASTSNQVILPNNSAYYFTGEVVSGVTGGGNSKGWTISGLIKRGANAAATTLVGSTATSLYADAGAATWTIGLTADTTNGGLAVTFTGQAATTIRTVCSLKTTEMTY